jgi:DNA-binding CsgD family transcriptional regulator
VKEYVYYVFQPKYETCGYEIKYPFWGIFLTFEIKNDIYSYMARMTRRDYLDVFDLIYNANRCEDMDGLVGAICPSIMQMFHTECCTFQLIEGYPRPVKIVESRSFKSDGLNPVEDKYNPSLYKDGYYQYSPLLKEAISSSENIFKIGDSISLRDWESSDFYNEFISPQHLYWEMFLPLRRKNNLEGMITLWRSRKQPDYKTSDVSKAEILTRHLMLTVNNIKKISNINNLKQQLLFTNEANNQGLLMLDHKLKPIYSDTKSREICLYLFSRIQPSSLDLEKGEFPIPSCIISDCRDLLNLLKAEERLALWPKERIIFADNGKRFRIECSLIWKADRLITLPHFLVTLSDLTNKKRLEVTLQAKFRLSRREIDIVYCIIAGMSYGEIAEELYISKLTVHTHIKNIYRKLGVKNKIELFRCVQSTFWLI